MDGEKIRLLGFVGYRTGTDMMIITKLIDFLNLQVVMKKSLNFRDVSKVSGTSKLSFLYPVILNVIMFIAFLIKYFIVLPHCIHVFVCPKLAILAFLIDDRQWQQANGKCESKQASDKSKQQ